jgi:hypothetical protein
MRPYQDAPHASMAMQGDPDLLTALEQAIRRYRVDVAIETGTFLGTGSTRFVAECMRRTGRPKSFVTMEVNFQNWCRAVNNLRHFAFVHCVWGCSVEIEQGLEFIANDDMIQNHTEYQDIYIDTLSNPGRFYADELRGIINFADGDKDPASVVGKERLWMGEGLLARYLDAHRDQTPLVILDSAGGIGLLEFNITSSLMKGNEYLLLLDDAHHVKHYRSLMAIKKDPAFVVLAENAERGWALAWHAVGTQ